MTRPAAPAWMATMPMLCATMSCSSRAIRNRSAWTARRAACARRLSPYSRRRQIELPAIQAMTVAEAIGAATPSRPGCQAPSTPIRQPPSSAARATTAAAVAIRRGRVAATYRTSTSVAARNSAHGRPRNTTAATDSASIRARTGSGHRRANPIGSAVATASAAQAPSPRCRSPDGCGFPGSGSFGRRP